MRGQTKAEFNARTESLNLRRSKHYEDGSDTSGPSAASEHRVRGHVIGLQTAAPSGARDRVARLLGVVGGFAPENELHRDAAPEETGRHLGSATRRGRHCPVSP